MHLRTVQLIENGNEYVIDVRNHNKNLKILEQCRETFKQPCLFQYIARVEPR